MCVCKLSLGQDLKNHEERFKNITIIKKNLFLKPIKGSFLKKDLLSLS